MTVNLLLAFEICLSICLAATSATANQVVRGAVPEAVARLRLQPVDRLPGTNQLRLAIGFPTRDSASLSKLLEEIYNPASTHYRQYLAPAQFAEKFGATEQDYAAVIACVKSNGLQVVRTHANRLLLDVTGSVSDIERAFHVTLRRYRHPTENREFYAPDAEPVLNVDAPVLQIDGLNNFALPAPMLKEGPAPQRGTPRAGSGKNGTYGGVDFRKAYAPGATQDGTGQMVGLVEFAGYFASDITDYEGNFGLPNVPLINVSVDGAVDAPGSSGEAPGDIEMVIAMATNLSAVVVFEATGQNTMASWNDMLSLMAASNQIKQFSCSWRLSSDTGSNMVGDQLFQQMGVQGQSFFKASGDGDAYVVPIAWPNDVPYITLVGGTQLTTAGPGQAYTSETVWNSGDLGNSWGGNGTETYWGSGGGVSDTYSLPSYQQGMNLSQIGGSSVKRNLPDVAMVSQKIDVFYDDGNSGGFVGTSFASPLWAGFMALANQAAAKNGLPSIGFANPALYAIGRATNYSNAFHDITTGNNQWPGSPTNYAAAAGYDLCTGWGSPNGTNLINALIDQLAMSKAPSISGATLAGGNLTLTTAHGTPGSTYTLLVATNVTLPMSQWKTNSSSAFSADGTSTNSVNVNTTIPGYFFRIRVP